MKYKRLVVTPRGSPETVQIAEDELRPPASGAARLQVLAAAVPLPDVEAALAPPNCVP